MGITTGFTPFSGNIGPLNRVTPFTHRDNATFLLILQDVIKYINTTLQTEITVELERILAEAQTVADNFEERSVEWQAFFDQFIIDVTANIATLNDMAIRDLILNELSLTRIALDARIDAKLAPVTASVTAETTARTNADTAQTTALGVTNGNATALAGRVTDLEAIYTTDPIDVVYIGDSYFTGYQPVPTGWITSVPERVNTLMNDRGLNTYVMHNYAQNAGGYDTTIGGGDTYFDTLVDQAIADTAITNCQLIVVGGGRNDAGKNVYTQAMAIYAKLRAKWPKAKIVVFPMWSREVFTAAHRRTFTTIFDAAKDSGLIYDTNSMWINAFTDGSLWIDSVLHPKTELADRFATALYSLIMGGSLPDRSIDFNVHSSTGTTVGVVSLSGFTATVSLQQLVGAAFDYTYELGNINYPVATPGGVNQYVVGYSGNGANITLYTIEAITGKIFTTGVAMSGVAGIVGFTTSYPLGV